MNTRGGEFEQERKDAEGNFVALLKFVMYKTDASQKEMAELLGYKGTGYISELERGVKSPTPQVALAVGLMAKLLSDERAAKPALSPENQQWLDGVASAFKRDPANMMEWLVSTARVAWHLNPYGTPPLPDAPHVPKSGLDAMGIESAEVVLSAAKKPHASSQQKNRSSTSDRVNHPKNENKPS